METESMHRITVIGAGFAGLSVIRTLRRLNKEVEITLISPQAQFHYLPGSIWIPHGLRTRQDLVVPLDAFLRRMDVRFEAGLVNGLRNGGRIVVTDRGVVPNDGLIIAAGACFIKKLPGIANAITPCEGIVAAERIRDRLREMSGGTIAVGFAGNPAEPGAMRGGPMFEYLFGIDRQLVAEGRRDKFELLFFSPAAQPGSRLGPRAVDALLAEMARRSIRTHLGHKLVRFEPDCIVTEGGSLHADMILFMPGLTGDAWLDRTALARSPGGLIAADAYCRAVGMERVYVAGDAGSFPGPDWMPKQAHMADLQAAAAARNLLSDLADDIPVATFRPELVCIVDSVDRGMLIYRTERRAVILPPLRVFHWAKRAFERAYLRRYA